MRRDKKIFVISPSPEHRSAVKSNHKIVAPNPFEEKIQSAHRLFTGQKRLRWAPWLHHDIPPTTIAKSIEIIIFDSLCEINCCQTRKLNAN